MKNLFTGIIVILFLTGFFSSCEHPIVAPVDTGTGGTGTPTRPVCFESEVLPLFISYCAKAGCHDAITQEDGYILDNYTNIIRKDIRKGDATNSKVYTVLFKPLNDPKRMPPAGHPGPSDAEKILIGTWINEGANNTVNCNTGCDITQFRYTANIKPILTTNCYGCHNGSDPNIPNLTVHARVQQLAISGQLYAAITHAPGAPPMPNGGTKLSDCQITVIKKWIDAGALNN